MAEFNGQNYSEIDSQNDKAPPNGVQVGMAAKNIYDILRTFFAATKKFFNRSNATVTSTGTGSAYALTYDVFAGYSVGEVIRFKAHVTCAATPTLSINGLSPATIVDNGSGADLAPEAIKANQFVSVIYDGLKFRLHEVMIPESRLKALETGKLDKSGGRMTGSLSSAVKDHGTLGAVTETYSFSDANTHKVTINGAHVINPTGLAEGDVMQVNILFQSGSISVSGTTQWEAGFGTKAATIADLGVTLTAGAAYRIVFEIVAGVRTAVIQ